MKTSRKPAATKHPIDQIAENKKYITKMIREGRKDELKGKFRFANPK